MSGANGQFNPNSGFENSTAGIFHRAETTARNRSQAKNQSSATLPLNQQKKLESYVRKGGIAGLVCMVWACAESLIFTAPDWGMGAAIFEAAMIALMLGPPAALLLRGRGLISAGILTFLILTSLIGVMAALAENDPLYGGSSVIVNLIFVALTGRAAYAAWKLRKVK